MSTYISLTNELLRRLGEVVMDSTEFDNARNVQALAKNSINSSIREVLHSAQEWPFTLQTYTQTLTIGDSTYQLPADTSSVDWESFYLKKFNDSTRASALPAISYSNYLSRFRPRDDNAGADGYSTPTYIFQTQDFKYGVTPIPNEAYEIEYKYWSFPAELVDKDDVCIIPERFSNVVLDGAMVYMMIYRSNEQSAALHKDRFDLGIKGMRRVLMDDSTSVVSSMITRTSSTSGSRVA
jgi:hypothetical protein